MNANPTVMGMMGKISMDNFELMILIKRILIKVYVVFTQLSVMYSITSASNNINHRNISYVLNQDSTTN